MSKRIAFINFLETFTSFIRNDATASRLWQLKDRNGILADDTDLAAKQDTLVSGTNIKTLNSNTLLGSADLLVEKIFYRNNVASSLTGTLSALVVDFVKIPAGILAANDWLRLELIGAKAGTAGNLTQSFYISPNLPTIGSAIPGGSILIGQIVSTAGSLYSSGGRTLRSRNSLASQVQMAQTDSFPTDLVTSANTPALRTINFAVDQYVMIIGQLGNTGDTYTLYNWEVKISRP